jgi:hypothetical protein
MNRPALFWPVAMGAACGAVVLAGGPALMLAAMGALLVVLAIMNQPLRGFLLFCLIAPVMPWSTVTVGIRVTLTEALLALTWAAVAWQWLLGRLPPLRWGPSERAMLRFMAWSIVPLVAGQWVTQPDEGIGPLNWVRWLLNLSPLFLVPLLVREARDRERLMGCLLLGYFAMVALSLGLFVATRDSRAMIPILSAMAYAHPEALQDILGGDFSRMASPWVHPNSTGGALLLAVPMAMFYGATHTGWRRAMGLAVALGGTAGIVFSGSRGALISLFVLILWLAYRRVPQAGRTLVIGGVLAAAMMAFYPPAQQRLMSLVSSNDASTGVRFEEYAHFPLAMAQYPLGIGFKVDPPATANGVYGISNLWLNTVYKLGLPGGLLFIAVTLAWWREVRQLGDVSRITPGRARQIGAVGALLAALTTGFMDHYFSFTQVLLALFWLTAAIGLQEARLASEADAESAPVPAPDRP